ncbi:MAG: polyprenyl diphosphate synthase [Mycobacteriales bacterium]
MEQLPEALPRHIAVIMDGNRRWAAERGLFVLDGHTAGRQTMVEMIDNILEIGVGHLSLFAFSTENWDRSEEEVSGLLTLLARTINEYVVDWHAKRVRLRWLGRRDRIPAELRTELESAERLTADNQRLNLSICLDYGGRDEIVRAAARLAASHIDPGSVTEKSFSEFLDEPTLPDVDLLIRTSGEQRTSNFMPWQAAYAELVFLPAHWPAFTREHLHEAVAEYGRRERRFGGNRRNLVAG